jgi:hypothetical protein
VFYNSLNNPTGFIQPSLLCAGTYSTDECNSTRKNVGYVGLLRISEFTTAGAASSYLNISDYQWTMNISTSNIRVITNTGTQSNAAVNNGYGVRPVVVLKNDILVASGVGTSTSPYRLVGDDSASINDSLNTRYSGEYVNYSNKIWRIVGKNIDGTTKLILNSNDGNRAFDTGLSQIFDPTQSANIGYYLNNTFYNSLTNNEYIADGIWYLGQWERNSDYTTAITGSTNTYAPVIAKVGLIRIDELFSGNDLDDNSSLWRTITPKIAGTFNLQTYTTQHTNVLSATGTYATPAQSIGNYATVAVRPVINLKSNICITNGTGLSSNPYTVNLCS